MTGRGEAQRAAREARKSSGKPAQIKTGDAITKGAEAAAKRAETAAKQAEQRAKRAEASARRAEMRVSAGSGNSTVRASGRVGRATARKTTARKTTAGRSTARTRSGLPNTITISPLAESGYTAEGPVSRVVDALGNNVVADILGVSRSQPSRWRSGQERLSPDNRKRISDLDHVLDRLLLELYPDQAGTWLTGPNPHLGGARPVDVLELRGAAAVLPAIDALAAGAFA
jgi:uncharacterized protein (DUF2384 family)